MTIAAAPLTAVPREDSQHAGRREKQCHKGQWCTFHSGALLTAGMQLFPWLLPTLSLLSYFITESFCFTESLDILLCKGKGLTWETWWRSSPQPSGANPHSRLRLWLLENSGSSGPVPCHVHFGALRCGSGGCPFMSHHTNIDRDIKKMIHFAHPLNTGARGRP